MELADSCSSKGRSGFSFDSGIVIMIIGRDFFESTAMSKSEVTKTSIISPIE